ncbi:endonuclease III domain-containing protein [Thermithiobacillus plumbiphilus]|uniref:Endonuclease III domain-containing protein n=1 Tax=Thermithiobacillus plumbiphilus TaxID=1729899 RepID=A0ABU9D425_9PROT
MNGGPALPQIYERLLAHFGSQHWWPGDTPFEVMVGAVLTQNTAWTNVEKAILRLRERGLLDASAMLAAPIEILAESIRPAGYYNVKARRLHALCAFLAEQGALSDPYRLRTAADIPTLRQQLLAVHGIGEETADSILLYALDLPSFVVDAYTRRIFTRLGVFTGNESYAAIQARFRDQMPEDLACYNEYHALIVMLGKSICRPGPRCTLCPLRETCGHADRVSD